MRMDPIGLNDYEARARLVLPHNYWEFIEAGAMDEITMARNRSAFEALTLRPRFMRETTEPKVSTSVLGTDISLPVMIAPMDAHLNAHPEAECAAEASTGPLWFQLSHRGYDLTENLVKRAETAGFRALVVTIDTPVATPKERDLRNHYQRPGEFGNFREQQRHVFDGKGTYEPPAWETPQCPPLTWREMDWLQGPSDLPIALKGIRNAEDARMAVEHGVNGIVVSTHGGRWFDGDVSSIETVPEIIAATEGKSEVYVDSGIRRGSDVLKALAMGATAVAIGRPV